MPIGTVTAEDPAVLVRKYPNLMEARDLAATTAMLAPAFEMVFPETGPMQTLGEPIARSKDRYRFVTKRFDGIEAFETDSVAMAYTRGTLAGAWPDGTAFEGIRFIDRFEVVGGKIRRQDVWNDLAEVRPMRSTRLRPPCWRGAWNRLPMRWMQRCFEPRST